MKDSFRFPRRLFFSAAPLLALTAGPAAAAAPGSAAETYSLATSDGAYTFFSDPRAIQYQGSKDKTYLGFLDKAGSDRVWSYDHATAKVDTFTLHLKLEVDDHDNPGLYVRKDGRLTAFYQRHNADKYVFSRTTMNPEDITAWGKEDTLKMPANATYCNPFRLDGEGGKLFLFDRDVGFHPTMSISPDEGKTWGAPVKIIAGPGERPYVKYASDGNNTIHIAFTTGHPRNEPFNSIYYMAYRNGAFYHADGTLIKTVAALPVEPAEADLVYDGHTAGKAWIWDLALDAKGRPVLVHSVMPSDSDHHYWYGHWNGKSWEDKEMTKAGKWFPQTPAGTVEPEPQYSGGIGLDPADPSIVYLSKPTGNIFEIEKWITSDTGKTWTSTHITAGSAKNNARPIMPHPVPGQHPRHRMLFWMNGDYIHYTNFATGIRYLAWDDPVTALRAPGAGATAGAGTAAGLRWNGSGMPRIAVPADAEKGEGAEWAPDGTRLEAPAGRPLQSSEP